MSQTVAELPDLAELGNAPTGTITVKAKAKWRPGCKVAIKGKGDMETFILVARN